MWTQETDTLLCDFCQLQQRYHLEAEWVSMRVLGMGSHLLTLRCLQAVSTMIWAKQPDQIPVRMLCGHDCNRCAPPTASKVC